MKRNLKIFLLFSFYSIKVTLQHPVGIIFFILGKIIRFAFFFVFIYFLVSKAKFIAGYTVNQALIFFLTFNFIDSLTQLLFREVYRFRPLVINGEFDSVLLKPYHPFIRILVGGVDILDALLIMPYLILLFYFVFKMPNLSLLSVGIFVFFLINAMVIATAFHIMILAIAILTTEIDHALMIYRDITKMAALPIDIYKEPLRSLLTFIIPVGIMMAVPVKSLFGMISLQTGIISLGITCLFFYLSVIIWKHAISKYQSVGS